MFAGAIFVPASYDCRQSGAPTCGSMGLVDAE